MEIPSMYVAMFDEYDEGTNIMKMADSYLGIPTDQYFLTSSADGSYISSDFYLRLVGKATRVLKGDDPVTPHVTIPFSEGPIYFRTSHEPGYDALPDWTNTPDEIGVVNVDAPTCSHVKENPHVGSYSLRFEGVDNSSTESHAAMKVFDVDIPVFDDSKLMFMSYPTNELSRYASVELVLTDGTTLSSTNAEDTNGQPMLPSGGRGEIDEWTKTICRIGEWLDTTQLSRDTIDRIIIVYDRAEETGTVKAYFDDISIYRLETDEVEIDNATFETPEIKTQMDPAESITVSVTAINIGTSSWTAARGYKLASRNPENNSIWGINRVELGTDSIPPGSKKTFTFDIMAPDSLGKYNFQWQMIRAIEGEEDISVGEKSENVVITVGDIDGTSFTEIYEGIITRRAEIHDREGADKAFDNLYKEGDVHIDWTKWLDNGGVPSKSDPSWIQIEFPDSVTVDLLSIVSGNDAPSRDPEDFVLLGSNDDSTWIELKSWAGQIWSSPFEDKLLPLDNSGEYRYYRLEITKNKGDDSMTQLCEIRLIQVGVFLSLPGKATDPVPLHDSIRVDVESTVSWTSGLDSDSHDVYFGTTDPPPFTGNQPDTTYSPGMLQYNTTYYWKINEKNSDGTKVGDTWSFTTELAFSDALFVSQAIPGDTVTPGEKMSVDVVLKNTGESTWDASKGQFSLGSQNPENNSDWGISKVLLENEELVLPGDNKTFTFNVTAPNTPGNYDFQWQMQNQEGWFGNPTDNVVITVQSTVGISDHLAENQILISNPANSGKIKVQVAYIEEPLVISIFSLEGRIVYQTRSSSQITEINISDYDKGLYLVRVQNSNAYNKALILLD